MSLRAAEVKLIYVVFTLQQFLCFIICINNRVKAPGIRNKKKMTCVFISSEGKLLLYFANITLLSVELVIFDAYNSFCFVLFFLNQV